MIISYIQSIQHDYLDQLEELDFICHFYHLTTYVLQLCKKFQKTDESPESTKNYDVNTTKDSRKNLMISEQKKELLKDSMIEIFNYINDNVLNSKEYKMSRKEVEKALRNQKELFYPRAIDERILDPTDMLIDLNFIKSHHMYLLQLYETRRVNQNPFNKEKSPKNSTANNRQQLNDTRDREIDRKYYKPMVKKQDKEFDKMDSKTMQ